MSNSIFLESVFVLHSRSFGDTSLILDLFTLKRGSVSAIARGVKKKGSRLSGLLLPFTPLVVCLSGKSEILNISKVEPDGLTYNFQGHSLLSGFYLNELLVRLLPKHDPDEVLYNIYKDTLHGLRYADNWQRQRLLRLFEIKLLQEIGYGVCLNKDAANNDIDESFFYKFKFGTGFIKLESLQENSTIFKGSNLLALYNDNLVTADNFKTAKLLLQNYLMPLLGDKPIKTRELF